MTTTDDDDLRVSWKSFCNQRMCEADRQLEAAVKILEQRFELTQLAIDKASTVMNARLESMNEFRNALKDQAAQFVTTTTIDALCGRIEALERAQIEYSQTAATLKIIIGIIGASLAAVIAGLLTGTLELRKIP